MVVEHLEIEPALGDQGVDAMFFRYWEGAATNRDESGTPTGRAYIELTGYWARKLARPARSIATAIAARKRLITLPIARVTLGRTTWPMRSA